MFQNRSPVKEVLLEELSGRLQRRWQQAEGAGMVTLCRHPGPGRQGFVVGEGENDRPPGPGRGPGRRPGRRARRDGAGRWGDTWDMEAMGDTGSSGAHPPDGEGDDGSLRASDADRERVAEVLRQHCQAGRLDVDEYADRVARAYQARTLPELFALTAGLPHPDAVVPSGGWALRPRRAGRPRAPSVLATLAPRRWAVVGFVVALAALVISVYGPVGWAIWVFWVFLGIFVVAGGATIATRVWPPTK